MTIPAEFDAALDAELAHMMAESERTMADFTPDYRPLNMYAIYRADLDMPPGKLAAQCGHAYVKAWRVAERMRPEICAGYEGTGNGTKLVMYARNLGQLVRAWKEARFAGIPCELIRDRGHILPPHFTGRPIVTALGIGPAYKDEVSPITKRFTLAP